MGEKCPTYMGNKTWIQDRILKSKKDKDAENNQFLIRHNMREQIDKEKKVIEEKLPKEFTKLMSLISREVLIKKPVKISLFISNFLDLLLECRNREEADYHDNNTAMRKLINESKPNISQIKKYLNSKIKSNKTAFADFSDENEGEVKKEVKREKTKLLFEETPNSLKEDEAEEDENSIIEEVGSYDYTMDEAEDEENEDDDMNINENNLVQKHKVAEGDHNVQTNEKQEESIQTLNDNVVRKEESIGKEACEDVKCYRGLEEEDYEDEEAEEKESYKNENLNNENEEKNTKDAEDYKDESKDVKKVDEQNYDEDFEDEETDERESHKNENVDNGYAKNNKEDYENKEKDIERLDDQNYDEDYEDEENKSFESDETEEEKEKDSDNKDNTDIDDNHDEDVCDDDDEYDEDDKEDKDDEDDKEDEDDEDDKEDEDDEDDKKDKDDENEKEGKDDEEIQNDKSSDTYEHSSDYEDDFEN